MESLGEPKWELGKGEGEGEGEEEEQEKGKETNLEKEVWRCLNSVHEMLCRRQILNQTLRKGWMELASARYEMGPARISQNMFSLKPHAAKTTVDVSPHTEGEGDEELSTKGPVLFEITRDALERRQKMASYDDGMNPNYKKKNSSQLRRRPVSTSAEQVESNDSEKDELLQYANLIDDSDSEDNLQPLEVQNSTFQGFGTIVSPNLRNAQGSFVKALQAIVELLNAQSDATDAHCKAKSFQVSMDSSMEQ